MKGRLMAVFLSWSGARSKAYAENLKTWLRRAVPDVPIFFSPDIDGGRRSYDAIGEGLRSCFYGICCLTPDNLDSPWLHFEAGAISNALLQNSQGPPLVPLLFDGLSDNQIKPPLSQFQMKANTKDDLTSIALAVNAARMEQSISTESVAEYCERFWSDYEEASEKIAATPTSIVPKRDVADMVEEILNIVRASSRAEATVSPQQAFEDYKTIIGLRSVIKERTEAFGYAVKVSGDGHSPDLIINGDLLVWIEAAKPHIDLLRLVESGDAELRRYQKRHNVTGKRLVVVGGKVYLHFTDDMRKLEASDKPFVWANPGQLFQGNAAALQLAPWLVDAMLTE